MNRIQRQGYLLGYALLLLAVFHPVWRGRLFFGWDCLREYWPDIVFQIHSLRDGELPLWNPYALGGYPFYGDPQAGLLAPVNWLLWGLSLPFGEGAWLIQAKVLINLWIGLVGMHVLVWRRTGTQSAAMVASVVYVLGSPLLVHKNGAFLWPLLYLPWAVLALERFFEESSPRRGAVLALTLWLCGSAGHPQSFFYDLLILGGYALFLAPRRLRSISGLIVFLVFATLLLLPIYLPASQAVAFSPRSHRGLAYVLQGSLDPDKLWELLVPNLDTDWMGDIYLGPLALLLAIGAVAVGKPERLLWLGMALLGLLLSLGSHTPLLPFLAEHVPGFDLFRIAYRHKPIFAFAIALLCGEGIADLLRGNPRRAIRVATALLASAWLIAVALQGRLLLLLTAGPTLVLAMWAAIDSRRARLALSLAPLFVGIDLVSAGKSKIDILQPPPSLDVGLLPPLQNDWRTYNDGVLPFHAPYLHEYRELSGFDNPIRLERQEKLTARVPKSPSLLATFGVRYWLTNRPVSWEGALRVASRRYEIRDPVPILRVYPRAERVPASRMLERLAQGDAALVDPADTLPNLPDAEGAIVDGRLVSHARNRVVALVETSQPGIAILNELYYPGWVARVNGAPAQVFRANYLLRAVVVPQGKNRIEFRFEPHGYGWMLCGFGLGLLGALSLACRRRMPDVRVLLMLLAACSTPGVPDAGFLDVSPGGVDAGTDGTYAGPLFDVHLHSALPVTEMTTSEMLETLADLGVVGVFLLGATGASEGGVVLPFLPLPQDSDGRMQLDEETVAYLEEQLQTGLFSGLGELPLRSNPIEYTTSSDEYAVDGDVPRQIYDLAASYGVPVLLHVEAAYADELERAAEHNRETQIIWAHLGDAQAELVAGVLSRNENLHADLSARNPLYERGFETEAQSLFEEDGATLADEWRELFEAYPDRVLYGTDLGKNDDWNALAGEVVDTYRRVLGHLSVEAAHKIACANAVGLTGLAPELCE